MDFKKYKNILSYIKDVISGTEFESHVYAVGGCVRDEILGNEIKDIDMVVDLERGGIRLAEMLQDKKLLLHDPVIYETYGTVMLRLKEFPDDEIECVHTRKEQYHDKNSRNPETAYGTLKEDCMRRDLTINALYRNVTTDEVIDPCGMGMRDIKDKIIEVTSTPDIVYEDDPLRIMRAVRFCCKMGQGWNMDSKTYDGLIKHANRLEIITKERIQDELNKILLTGDYGRGIIMLKRIGAMKYVIPELEQTYDMKQNGYHFGTVWEHTLSVLSKADCVGLSQENTLILRLAAILHDIGKIETYSEKDGVVHFYRHEVESGRLVDVIMRRLKYSNDMISAVRFLCERHMDTKPWGDDLKGFCNDRRRNCSIRKLQYKCKNQEKFDMLLRLIDADNNSHAQEHCLPNQVRNIRTISEDMKKFGTDMFGYKLPVDGNDIMEYKNLKPGPDVRKYMNFILKECYANPLISKSDALRTIKNLKVEQT